MKKIKMGEIFNCDGKLYTITMPNTASVTPNLENGRLIIELIDLRKKK